MRTVLVTGAGGYIGSILVPKLLNKGYKVIAIDRYFFGMDLLEKHEHLTVVREDARKLNAAHFDGVDAVVDLVAISNDPSGELFMEATYQINYQARVNTAKLAKQAGVKRYLLPSSCSIYGFQAPDVIVDETSPSNPLTTYAKANERAELEILPLSDRDFTVAVLRQATVYGYSPRMRFDLAVNSMTYGAWETGAIPLNRNGTQWRPLVHVEDTTDAMCLMLDAEQERINGQIFNVGSNRSNYQLQTLAEEIAAALPIDVRIEWYGEPDHRSYRVNFDKIGSALQWEAKHSVAEGAREIFEALAAHKLMKEEQTITLKWYQELVKWHKIVKECEMYGGIVEIG
jgi:nucleoside-diphosphate-sugar epimerase